MEVQMRNIKAVGRGRADLGYFSGPLQPHSMTAWANGASVA
jgi:hypothetical protein